MKIMLLPQEFLIFRAIVQVLKGVRHANPSFPRMRVTWVGSSVWMRARLAYLYEQNDPISTHEEIIALNRMLAVTDRDLRVEPCNPGIVLTPPQVQWLASCFAHAPLYMPPMLTLKNNYNAQWTTDQGLMIDFNIQDVQLGPLNTFDANAKGSGDLFYQDRDHERRFMHTIVNKEVGTPSLNSLLSKLRGVSAVYKDDLSCVRYLYKSYIKPLKMNFVLHEAVVQAWRQFLKDESRYYAEIKNILMRRYGITAQDMVWVENVFNPSASAVQVVQSETQNHSLIGSDTHSDDGWTSSTENPTVDMHQFTGVNRAIKKRFYDKDEKLKDLSTDLKIMHVLVTLMKALMYHEWNTQGERKMTFASIYATLQHYVVDIKSELNHDIYKAMLKVYLEKEDFFMSTYHQIILNYSQIQTHFIPSFVTCTILANSGHFSFEQAFEKAEVHYKQHCDLNKDSGLKYMTVEKEDIYHENYKIMERVYAVSQTLAVWSKDPEQNNEAYRQLLSMVNPDVLSLTLDYVTKEIEGHEAVLSILKALHCFHAEATQQHNKIIKYDNSM